MPPIAMIASAPASVGFAKKAYAAISSGEPSWPVLDWVSAHDENQAPTSSTAVDAQSPTSSAASEIQSPASSNASTVQSPASSNAVTVQSPAASQSSAEIFST